MRNFPLRKGLDDPAFPRQEGCKKKGQQEIAGLFYIRRMGKTVGFFNLAALRVTCGFETNRYDRLVKRHASCRDFNLYAAVLLTTFSGVVAGDG